MTIMQLTLALLLVAIIAFVLIQNVVRRVFKAVFVGFLIIGVLFVVLPGMTNDIASFLGVGRGADVVLYFLAIMNIGVFAILLLRTTLMYRAITKLIRHEAIKNARWPDSTDVGH